MLKDSHGIWREMFISLIQKWFVYKEKLEKYRLSNSKMGCKVQIFLF